MVRIIAKCTHCKGKNELNDEKKRILSERKAVGIKCCYCEKYFAVEQNEKGFETKPMK